MASLQLSANMHSTCFWLPASGLRAKVHVGIGPKYNKQRHSSILRHI